MTEGKVIIALCVVPLPLVCLWGFFLWVCFAADGPRSWRPFVRRFAKFHGIPPVKVRIIGTTEKGLFEVYGVRKMWYAYQEDLITELGRKKLDVSEWTDILSGIDSIHT